MGKLINKIKNLFLNLFFPKKCVFCQKKGVYLCYDCLSLIEISTQQFCPFCFPPKPTPSGECCFFCKKTKTLSRLYFATSYQNFMVKELIKKFKYSPYIKELGENLAFLIISHLQLLENKPEFLISSKKEKFLLVPVPLEKEKMKMKGFNHAQILTKILSSYLKIPFEEVLTKKRKTKSQTTLSSKKEREENIKGVFEVKKEKENLIKNKIILLVDDVFTTGATMEEISQILKTKGAKEIWGIVVAKG